MILHGCDYRLSMHTGRPQTTYGHTHNHQREASKQASTIIKIVTYTVETIVVATMSTVQGRIQGVGGGIMGDR